MSNEPRIVQSTVVFRPHGETTEEKESLVFHGEAIRKMEEENRKRDKEKLKEMSGDSARQEHEQAQAESDGKR